MDRRAIEKRNIEDKKKARELRVLKEVGITEHKNYVKPQDYVENPRYTATW
jgi:hypothetical protein